MRGDGRSYTGYCCCCVEGGVGSGVGGGVCGGGGGGGGGRIVVVVGVIGVPGPVVFPNLLLQRLHGAAAAAGAGGSGVTSCLV